MMNACAEFEVNPLSSVIEWDKMKKILPVLESGWPTRL